MTKALLIQTNKYWGWEHRSDNINQSKGWFDLAWVIPKSQYDKMDVQSQSYHYPLYFLFREGEKDDMHFTPTEIEKIGKEYDIFLEKEVSGFPIEDTLTILKKEPTTYQSMFKEAPSKVKSYQDIVDWFADTNNKAKEGDWEVTKMTVDIDKIITALEEEEERANKLQEAALDASTKDNAAETVLIVGNKKNKEASMAHIIGMEDKEGFTPKGIIGGNESLDNPSYAKIVEDGAKAGRYDNHAESVGFAAENLEYKFAIISKYDDSILPSTDTPEGLETIGKVHVTLVGGKALKPFKAALKENAKEAIAGLPEAPTPVFGDMGIAERTMGDGEVRKTAFLEVDNQEDFHDYVDTVCDALGIENPESDRWFHVSIANNHGGNPFKSVGDITEADLRGSHSAEYFAFNAEGENMPLYVYDAECGCMKRADTLKFKDWANQEQQSHGDPSFGEWADEEGDEHGDTSFDDWAEHETASHEARFEAEYEDSCPICSGEIFDSMEYDAMGYNIAYCDNCDLDIHTCKGSCKCSDREGKNTIPIGDVFCECGFGQEYGSRTPCESCEPISEKIESHNTKMNAAESFNEWRLGKS